MLELPTVQGRFKADSYCKPSQLCACSLAVHHSRHLLCPYWLGEPAAALPRQIDVRRVFTRLLSAVWLPVATPNRPELSINLLERVLAGRLLFVWHDYLCFEPSFGFVGVLNWLTSAFK